MTVIRVSDGTVYEYPTCWRPLGVLLAQVVVMPMMGGGLFSSQMGGMMLVMGSLIGHLVYGAMLGCITGGPVRT